MDFHICINERLFKWQMDIDPGFGPDAITSNMFGRNIVPEKEVFALMHLVIKEGDTVIDAGANIGMFTIFLSQVVGPKGKVIAFEPSRVNFSKLKKNLELNNITAELHNWALSDERAVVPWFEHPKDTGMSSMHLPDLYPSYAVDTYRLDDWLHHTPRLIKIDCEGSEEKVLRGAENMLRRGVQCVVCEIADFNLKNFNSDQHAVRNYMHGLGYDTWVLRPDGALPVYVPCDVSLVSRFANLNVLFATMRTVANLWPAVNVDEYHAE